MTPIRNTNRIRTFSAGLVATLLLTVSSTALRADTSNAELAKEIAELKAQIRSMKGAITQNRAETRKAVRVARTPAPGYALPPPSGPAFPYGAIPPGATPAFVTADKKLQFGALTITPGGFFARESAMCSAAVREQAGLTRRLRLDTDEHQPFGPGANVGENRIEARGVARRPCLIEAPITPQLSWRPATPSSTSCSRVSARTTCRPSSFVPRIRNLYATLDNVRLRHAPARGSGVVARDAEQRRASRLVTK